MKKAINIALKEYKDIEKLKVLIDRFVVVFNAKEKTEHPLRKRGMDEFFGQKAFQKPWLICSEYDDEGAQWRNRDDIPKAKTVRKDFFGDIIHE